MPSLAYPERQRHPDIRICRPHRYSLERFLPRSVVSCGTLPWGRKARRRAFGGQEKSHPNLFSVAEAPKTTIYQVHPPPSQADCGIADPAVRQWSIRGPHVRLFSLFFGGGCMKAVVTGGAGFLGSHLCDRLLAEGWDVLALDNLVTGADTNIDHLMKHQKFRIARADVSSYI